MQFKDVIGQTELIHKLCPLVQQKQLPHAMMIVSQAGGGAMPLAMALAQYISCTNKNEFDSCGDCPSCIKLAKMQHPDVHYSFPTYKKDTSQARAPISNDFLPEFRAFMLANPYGNDTDWLAFLNTEKQGNITALECREIIQKLNMRSFESEYKIMIIWYPEYLDKEGNILLKLIEEPTAKTILMLVSEQPDAVLPTIQSRTQFFPLKRIQDVDIKNALMNRGLSEQLATQYARMAEGNLNYAFSLIEATDHDFVNRLRDWLNFMYTNKGTELVEWVNALSSIGKEEQKKFLEYFNQLLEHLLRIKLIGPDNLVLLDAERKMIDVLMSKGMNEFLVEEMTQLISESLYEIERNANSKILFHSLSLRIQKLVLSPTKILRS